MDDPVAVLLVRILDQARTGIDFDDDRRAVLVEAEKRESVFLPREGADGTGVVRGRGAAWDAGLP